MITAGDTQDTQDAGVSGERRPDSELGQEAADGVIDDLYRAHNPLVRTYLRRYLPDADNEDVLQLVFYELWRSWSRYDDQRPLRAWILGIARKKAIDHLRKRRDETVSAETLAGLTGDDGRRDADRFAWADEMSMHLARLPDAQKHVIVMAYYGQQSQTEIAAALRIPLGTVKTRTARGLHRLSELFAEANRPPLPTVVGTSG